MRARKRGRNFHGSMRVKVMRSAGSSVIASSAAIAMARFLEYASGLKRRPSWSTSVKIGRNATAITSSEKKTDGPTSLRARSRTSWKSPLRPPSIHSSSRLYAFSTSTIAPSTSTPIEIAMPASDIRFASTPMSLSGMNESATDAGIVRIGTIDDGKCQRNNRMMSETTSISSASLCETVLIAARMSSERS